MRKITRDSFPHIVWVLKRLLQTKIDSFLVRLIASWWGVSLGKHCIFRGFPIFNRLPGSKIIVGNECMFCSSPDANQGGISRRCILWTMNKNAKIQIGDECGFSGTVINAQRDIRIGNRVRCGTNTQIMDSDMHSDEDHRVSGPKSVVIEDGVWLGMNVVVLKGVTIGKGTLVGANSLVKKSLPANVIATGNPARIIRKIEQIEKMII